MLKVVFCILQYCVLRLRTRFFFFFFFFFCMKGWLGFHPKSLGLRFHLKSFVLRFHLKSFVLRFHLKSLLLEIIPYHAGGECSLRIPSRAEALFGYVRLDHRPGLLCFGSIILTKLPLLSRLGGIPLALGRATRRLWYEVGPEPCHRPSPRPPPRLRGRDPVLQRIVVRNRRIGDPPFPQCTHVFGIHRP
jgi:hypothetical protein